MAGNRSKASVYVRGWRFVRVSLEYIDVTPPGCSDAVDCINVFDYERGESDVPWTAAATRKEATRWLRDNEADLHNYAALGRY